MRWRRRWAQTSALRSARVAPPLHPVSTSISARASSRCRCGATAPTAPHGSRSSATPRARWCSRPSSFAWQMAIATTFAWANERKPAAARQCQRSPAPASSSKRQAARYGAESESGLSTEAKVRFRHTTSFLISPGSFLEAALFIESKAELKAFVAVV
eukprot:Amastigsp_a179042_8.p2 type:complete len:158 gc:universal Amastigsp_a179042_8:345-818(+)